MRHQSGFIGENGKNWFCRWREGVTAGGEIKRKLQYKTLREITSEDRKSRDRKTGKLRVPADVQKMFDVITARVNGEDSPKSLLAIAEAIAQPGESAIELAEAIEAYRKARIDTTLLLTISDLAETRFFPKMEKDWKPSSVANYRFLWNRYLKPSIGQNIVRGFERKHADQLWETIHQQYPHLRKRSVMQIRAVLHSIFLFALDKGLYHGENPAKASLPKGLPENKVTEAYSIDEVRVMLTKSIDPKLSAVVAMFFGSGMRRGEVAGFTWENYKRLNDGAKLHITQAAWAGKIQTPKTKQSVGTIDLGESFCTYIDAYRASLPAGADSGLMFTGRFPDQPMDMAAYSKSHLEPLLKAAGIPYRGGFHAFRRGNSTFVARALNSEAAAALSRHTVEMAETHYIKTNEQERRGAQAAKIASIESKRAEMRRQAAQSLSAGLEQVQ